MVVPIIPRSPTTRCRRCRGLREGFMRRATKAKVAVRVVFPAALSGIVARSSPPSPRSGGDDDRRPGRGRPQVHLNPDESIQAMTTTSRRRPPRHSTARSTTNRSSRSLRPVLHDAGDERDRHQAGPQVSEVYEWLETRRFAATGSPWRARATTRRCWATSRAGRDP